MLLKAEVTGRFDDEEDASKLLYAPLAEKLKFRESRRYTVEFDGSEERLTEFLRRVLADGTSHELSLGGEPAIKGASFLLDYGMKPGALDLEKETVQQYYAGLKDPGFELKSFKIERRIYVFGGHPPASDVAARFVRDIVNPAIHHWQVTV